MKIAKCFLAMILVLAALLTLAACSEEPPAQPDWKNIKTGSEGTLSELGYYYFDNHCILHYADLATGNSVALCSLPGCPHEEEDCEGYIDAAGFSGNMFFANDHLYYYENPCKLHSRSAIGTEEKLVGVICEKYLEDGCGVDKPRMMPSGKWMYYTTTVYKEDAGGDRISETVVLGRMDLTNGKDTVIYEHTVQGNVSLHFLRPGAVRENGILYLQCDGIEAKWKDPDYQQKSEEAVVKLQHWDADTGKVTTLLEKPQYEMMELCVVYGQKLYYYGRVTADGDVCLFSYDLNTGAAERIPDMDPITSWMGGSYVTVLGAKPFNLETWEFVAQEGRRIVPVAVSDIGFVTRESVPREDKPNDTAAVEYYYIPFSAMADGIQDSDKTLLYTLKMGGQN